MQADPLTQNRYAFAGANPVGAVEFDGHRRIDCVHACAIGRAPTGQERRKERRYRRQRAAREQSGYTRRYNSADYNQQASPSGSRALAQERQYATATMAVRLKPLPRELVITGERTRFPRSPREAFENFIVGLDEEVHGAAEQVARTADTLYRNFRYKCQEPWALDKRNCPTDVENQEAAAILSMALPGPRSGRAVGRTGPAEKGADEAAQGVRGAGRGAHDVARPPGGASTP